MQSPFGCWRATLEIQGVAIERSGGLQSSVKEAYDEGVEVTVRGREASQLFRGKAAEDVQEDLCRDQPLLQSCWSGVGVGLSYFIG